MADKDISFSWVNDIGTRDGTLTKDALMVNCFAEKTASGTALVKRPGTQYISGPALTGTAQGQFSFAGTFYFIVNDSAYLLGFQGDPGTIGIPIPGVTQTGLPYTSISSVEAGAPQTTLQNSAGQLWTFNGSTFTKVTDANYTSTSVAPGLSYLDGVYYAMRVDGEVIGSAINDPTTWPALDFVQADVTYGAGISTLRHLNYILAFYEQGLQVFWDANAAPNGSGIALQPVLSASYNTGCFHFGSIVELSDVTFFIGQNAQFGRTVQMLSGLQLQQISTPFIEKILNQTSVVQITLGLWSFGLNISGHKFYVLTLADLGLTLVYDVNNQIWGTWSSQINGTSQHFIGRFQMRSEGIPGEILQDVTTGRQVLLSPTLYTEANGSLTVSSATPPMDWGSMNYKRFSAMFQFADNVDTNINISYSDNDYQTFSMPRVMSLQYPRKQLRNCGRARRRAWKMTHTDNTPLRLFGMDIPLALLSA